jgi:DNA-binding HxlR family transcriptional regulator
MARSKEEAPIGRPGDAEMIRLIFLGKWRLKILEKATRGPVRLSELRRSIPEASKKMLIDTVHALEGLGWIVRTDHGGTVRRVDYRIAPMYAEAIDHILISIQGD